MKITEVRIMLMEDSDDRLQAFCSITFDDSFVVRDLKIIDGINGPFVAMPSRKITAHCPNCGCKNHLRAAHCNHCGMRIKEDHTLRDPEGRVVLYADIAHPINSTCREMIQKRVIAEFLEELERASRPDYVSNYNDDYDSDPALDARIGESSRGAGSISKSGHSELHSPEPLPRPPHRLPENSAPAIQPSDRADHLRTDSAPNSDLPDSRCSSGPGVAGMEPQAIPTPPRRRGNEGFGQGVFT